MKNGINPLLYLVGILIICVGIWSTMPPDAQAAKENSRGSNQYYDGTVSSMSGETHIYYFGGVTPTVPYARFYNRVTQQGYSSATGKMVAKASIVWADSEVLMTDETSTVGGWLIVVPAETVAGIGMPDGWYDVLIYERVTGTPLSTDTLYIGRSCKVYNVVIISFDDR